MWATNRGAGTRALALSFNSKAGTLLLPQVIQALRLGLLAFMNDIERHWLYLNTPRWTAGSTMVASYKVADRAGFLRRRPLSDGTEHSWIAHFVIVPI